MSERVEAFQCTIPAGTAVASAVSFPLDMDPGVTRRIEVVVPPGPSGYVGFRLRHSGQVIVPWSGTQWIIADGEVLKWELEGYPTGDAWTLLAYNTDIYQHTLYVRWFLDEIPGKVPGALAPIAIE